ncbi:3-carboxy-cis,cis-muconate cycloisomerase [Rhodovastum atsumiense]|uniref:Adenylosuccinate lyase family protein n=1 Tax=Rhodovastum atsumiense TaxID=504468 RepID=A0A5M6IS13_9PROT|nr:adenylosuccinate lyase family protein [Rhodovastum atsumiense]KAA5611083.1 adenylosuccinate lyase family protein [Rhodovastum atsumiense]CAH2599143.1 3-carboxy-cis,cis-muconate cycloisomerase [Rhodovastum atsumiense]
MPTNPADSQVMGTLYGSDAMRAVFEETAFLQRMLDTEAALARVQAGLGLIPEDAAETITAVATIENLDTAELAASTRQVGYPVVGLVKGLARAAGQAGAWTHWGATTQDIIDTAVVLQVREGLALIRAELIGTIRVLARLTQTHRRTVMAGRAHLQHALPITFGLKCAVWLQPLAAHVQRLDQLRPRVELVQFGGAAGTLASLGPRGLAVMERLAAELGLHTAPAPWHVARDGLAEAVSFLGLLCGSLGKIATDVTLLAQTEIGEVNEPYVAGRGGSSTMPQTRNPIASEYVLAAVRGVQALVPLMQGAMLQDHERATGPWQAEALALPQAFVLTHGALQQAHALIEGLVVDPARMRRNLEGSGGLIMAEAVMMGLAPELGREAAHHAVQHACDRALADGLTLVEALAQEKVIAARLDRAAIERLTDPARYLGSSEAFIDRVLAAAHATL